MAINGILHKCKFRNQKYADPFSSLLLLHISISQRTSTIPLRTFQGVKKEEEFETLFLLVFEKNPFLGLLRNVEL
jgi:hypothetical protein